MTTKTKMKPIDDKKEATTLRTVSRDEEGKKNVEKAALSTRNPETIKYIERKLADKGLHRLERHPVDGLGGIGRPPPKSGHGRKYTWEGPDNEAEVELDPSPPAVDEKDPNYVDEEEEEKIVRGEEEEVKGLVVGEVAVAKEAPEGVARVDVDPRFQVA